MQHLHLWWWKVLPLNFRGTVCYPIFFFAMVLAKLWMGFRASIIPNSGILCGSVVALALDTGPLHTVS